MNITVFLVLILMASALHAQKKNSVRNYSDEWELTVDDKSGTSIDALEELKNHDLSRFWLSGEDSENGVFGNDFWRIEFHISEVKKDAKNPLLYHIKGKDKHKTVVTPFNGELLITKAMRYSSPHEMNELYYPLKIAARFQLTEDASVKYSGRFSGALRTDLVYKQNTPNEFELDQEGDDGYMNNTFVGIFTSNKGKVSQCIWGLERLPYTKDWDIGAGEIFINSKYLKNGWESYMSQIVMDNPPALVKWWE